jgi:hypothetical protein
MTRDGRLGPMRTEDDLRQALATLERHAPSADTVLGVVRRAPGPAGPGRPAWRRPGGSAWWRRPRLALFLAAGAAAAGLVAALLPGSGSPGPGTSPGQLGLPRVTVGRTGLPRLTPGQANLPTAASVGQAMLTAFHGVSDDIEYTAQTGVTKGVTTSIYGSWSWPAHPAVGEEQSYRTVLAQPTPQTPALTVTEDNEISYITPPAGVQTVRGQVSMVCYAGTGQTGCSVNSVQTPPGTWSQVSQTVWVSSGSDVGPGGTFSAGSLAQGIAKGYWQVVGRTRLAGQPAIELNETGRGPLVYDPLPTLLWVNTRTHLPIRMVNGVGRAQVGTEDFAFLPPTRANLALLRVRIPPGYPRSVPSR